MNADPNDPNFESTFALWADKYGPMLGLRRDDLAHLKVAYVAYMVGAMEMQDILQKPNMN